jgi:hypothetical protein
MVQEKSLIYAIFVVGRWFLSCEGGEELCWGVWIVSRSGSDQDPNNREYHEVLRNKDYWTGWSISLRKGTIEIVACVV